MRIGICDDNRESIEQSEAILREYLEQRQEDVQFLRFSKGEQVLELLRNQSDTLDVLFQDIELEQENGVELVQRIQKEKYRMPVVFLTNYFQYCSDVYEVDCCFFVLKDNLKTYLPSIMKKVKEYQLSRKREILVLDLKGRTVLLPIQNILYCERSRRTTTLVTAEEKIRTNKEWSTICEELNCGKEEFFRCHNSFVIHFSEVKEYRVQEFLMKNGDLVPISRAYQKQIKQDFAAWLGRGG